MSRSQRHLSSSALPGPPKMPPKPPPPKRPPRSLHMLWVVGLIATLALLFLPGRSSPDRKSLTFTEWLGQVNSDQIHTATIDPSGNVTGFFDTPAQAEYSTRIPSALN